MADTENILKLLADDLEKRIPTIHNRGSNAELKQANPVDLIDVAAPIISIGSQKNKSLADIVARVGHRVRDRIGLKRDSLRACRVGVFILNTFYNCGLLDMVLEKRDGDKNNTYYVDWTDEEAESSLWELISVENTECLPSFDPVADWMSGVHANGLPLVRHAPHAILKQFNIIEHEIIFNVLNKLQSQAWNVDKQMLKWYVSAFNTPSKATYVDEDGGYHYAFDHLNPDENKKARSSMRREANSIRSIAKKMKGEAFYHQYNLDFRGRVYPTTNYLHEQSSDRAKGLLVFDQGKVLGSTGWRWLCIHTANSWGNDKISLDDRVKFSEDNYNNGDWVSYAEDPSHNKGWIQADKPWSFLHCCLEMKRIKDWIDSGYHLEDYVCNMPVYIDGSNNGVQHLTALSLDDTVAPLVNLVPQDVPGDVYMFIADHVWAKVQDDYDPNLDQMYLDTINELKELKAPFEDRMTKDEWQSAVDAVNSYRDTYNDQIRTTAPNYWNAVSSSKERRKVCKRPVMTLGYGGTRFGFKDQVILDSKKMSTHFRNMEFSHARYLADYIYYVCRGNDDMGIDAQLPGPAKMLEIFETIASTYVDNGDRLQWTVPLTNFIVVQQYRKPKTSRVEVNLMGKDVKLNIKIVEDQKVHKKKQITSAAPNIVHSIDAGHLQITVNACDYPVAVVHDSFGCLPGDMDNLFTMVRQTFVDMYKTDPLKHILTETKCLHLMPERGTLDIEDVLRSDFAFA